MDCPECGAVAKLSSRRGLKEGVFDRLMLHALYRCFDCGLRWKVKAPMSLAFKKTRRAETFSEYIGYGDERGRTIVQRAVMVVLLFVIIVTAIFQIQKKPLPRTIQVDATGKRVK